MTDWEINDDSLCGKKHNNYRNSWDAIKKKRGQSEFVSVKRFVFLHAK